MKDIINLKNVELQFKKRKIINNINLKIRENEIVAIMGLSGSGKTTILNLISGLVKPTGGEVIVNNQNIEKLQEPHLTTFRNQNISYIFQDYKLIDYITVSENIAITQNINHNKINNNILSSLINNLELESHLRKKVSHLSGGQKQRVAIARSMIGNNNIICADEPTGALDPITRDKIMKLLTENVKKYKKTLIIVTHDPIVAAYAEKIIFINNHEIVKKINQTTSENIMKEFKELMGEDDDANCF